MIHRLVEVNSYPSFFCHPGCTFFKKAFKPALTGLISNFICTCIPLCSILQVSAKCQHNCLDCSQMKVGLKGTFFWACWGVLWWEDNINKSPSLPPTHPHSLREEGWVANLFCLRNWAKICIKELKCLKYFVQILDDITSEMWLLKLSWQVSAVTQGCSAKASAPTVTVVFVLRMSSSSSTSNFSVVC